MGKSKKDFLIILTNENISEINSKYSKEIKNADSVIISAVNTSLKEIFKEDTFLIKCVSIKKILETCKNVSISLYEEIEYIGDYE